MSDSPHDPTDLAHALRRLWHSVVSEVRHSDACAGIPHQQFWVLGMLSRGPMRMTELAEHLGTATASVTGMVDRLEERGLVERVRDEADRRVVHVAITEQGEQAMADTQAEFSRRFGEVLEPLTAEERQEFARILGKIVPPREGGR